MSVLVQSPRPDAVLIDIDGVLTVSWKPLDGAVRALKRLRAAALPLALVTDITSRTRASIATLAAAGFPITAENILTAPVIAGAYRADHYPGARCLLLNSGDIREDLAGVTLVGADDPARVDVVIVGGAGSEFSYQALNRAFGHLQGGAKLVALHRGMYRRTAEGLQLDSGALSWAWSRPREQRRRWSANRPRISSPPRSRTWAPTPLTP